MFIYIAMQYTLITKNVCAVGTSDIVILTNSKSISMNELSINDRFSYAFI